MFILQSPENKDNVHFLYCGPKLLISRIRGHIVLPNDKSVSREHANVSISHDIKNVDDSTLHPEIILEDLGSRYGTYINEGIASGEKLTPYTPHPLCDGDSIRFGLLNNVWKLSYKHMVACSSLVENLDEVKSAVQLLGGHVSKNWTTDCNLLIMRDLLLTAKAVCALSSCSNIVTTEYLASLFSAIQKKTQHPIPLNFLPPLKEMCIGKENVSFAPNEKRKCLFAGKVFLFTSVKSMTKLKCAVLLSGGTVELLSMENVHLLANVDHILINQLDSKNRTTALIEKANDILRRNSLTSVPESDIGLAIVHVSTTKYCNPRFNVNNLLCRKQDDAHHPTQSFEIYATETQYDETLSTRSTDPPTRTVVAESGQSSRRAASFATPLLLKSPAPLPSLQPPSTPATTLQSLTNQPPTVPVILPSLPTQLPSLPIFLRRQNSMEDDTCMSTQSQVSPVKDEQRETNKRERLASNEPHSPVHKKQRHHETNAGNPISVGTDIGATVTNVNGPAEQLTQPFCPPYHSSMRDEELFSLEESSSYFLDNNDTEKDIKPSILQPRTDIETGQANIFKCPEPPKRKNAPTSPILESRVKRARSDDAVDCSQIATKPSTVANPFALPFTSSRRERKVEQPISTLDAVVQETVPEEQKTAVRVDLDHVRENATSKLRSPVKSENAEPFMATQIKNEKCSPQTPAAEGEKSLVVVEIVSLLRHPMRRMSLQDVSASTSVAGVNFKQFKKTWNGSCSAISLSLPRIIGGDDLAASIVENPQKESFLASQQHHEPDPQPEPESVMRDQQIENEFSLPIPKRARTRAR